MVFDGIVKLLKYNKRKNFEYFLNLHLNLISIHTKDYYYFYVVIFTSIVVIHTIKIHHLRHVILN